VQRMRKYNQLLSLQYHLEFMVFPNVSVQRYFKMYFVRMILNQSYMSDWWIEMLKLVKYFKMFLTNESLSFSAKIIKLNNNVTQSWWYLLCGNAIKIRTEN